MKETVPRVKRTVQSYSSADSVRVSLPLPSPGEIIETEFPRYGLTVVIERRSMETQEQARARFVLTAPLGNDNRTHAARMGTGVNNPKKLAVTLCMEESANSRPSGNRIPGLQLEHITCTRCRSLLAHEGVILVDQEGSGS